MERTKSPHPLIARIPLPCSFLFPLLISLLLFPLLGTPVLSVWGLFLIPPLVVWWGVVDVLPAGSWRIGRGSIRKGRHSRGGHHRGRGWRWDVWRWGRCRRGHRTPHD